MYPRTAVVALKTAETWIRTEGRTVKSGCQPLKMAKLRASTVGKRREVEVLREAGPGSGDPGSDVMQGLYARLQTEPFVPNPVVDVSPRSLGHFSQIYRLFLVCRVLCQRITLATSTCMFRQCYPKALPMYLVSEIDVSFLILIDIVPHWIYL